MRRLKVTGTFDVPEGTEIAEAVLRFGIRLKQVASDGSVPRNTSEWHADHNDLAADFRIEEVARG